MAELRLGDGMQFEDFFVEIMRSINSVRDNNECLTFSYTPLVNGRPGQTETRQIRSEDLLHAVAQRTGTDLTTLVSEMRSSVAFQVGDVSLAQIDERVDVNNRYQPDATPGQCVAEPARGPAIS